MPCSLWIFILAIPSQGELCGQVWDGCPRHCKNCRLLCWPCSQQLVLQVRVRVLRKGGSSLVTDAMGNPISFSWACNSNLISFWPCGGAGLQPCCKQRHQVPTHSAAPGREDQFSQQVSGKQGALEVLGFLLNCQDFSRNPAAQTSALANCLSVSAWSPGLSPHGKFGHRSGM